MTTTMTTPPAPAELLDTPLAIGERTFRSRLMVGTGKYRTFQEMARCLEESGADMVTVAVRRVNVSDRSKESTSCPVSVTTTSELMRVSP